MFKKGNTIWVGRHHSEETKRKMSEWQKGKILSEETRNKIGEANKNRVISKETKKKISEMKKGKPSGMKGKYHTEEHKKKISESLKGEKNHFFGKKHSEESKRKISEANKGKKHSEEAKKKMSEYSKKIGRKPPSPLGKKQSDEQIKKRAELHRGMKRSEETKKRISNARKGKNTGINNPNWLGGKSFEPYAVDWTETLRRSIRERDKYTCRICGMLQSDISYHIHHIDYNKKNCNPDNLVTLCVNCHTKTNGNRDYWIEYFKLKKEIV